MDASNYDVEAQKVFRQLGLPWPWLLHHGRENMSELALQRSQDVWNGDELLSWLWLRPSKVRLHTADSQMLGKYSQGQQNPLD